MSRQHPSQQGHGPFYASDATLSFTTNREEPTCPLSDHVGCERLTRVNRFADTETVGTAGYLHDGLRRPRLPASEPQAESVALGSEWSGHDFA